MVTVQTKPVTRATGAVPMRGIHHLALNTDDMKSTIDFWCGVLGMRLVHAMKVPAGISRGNPPFERIRHYFFDMGNDSLVAFFEIPKGAKAKTDRDAIGGMQHCSFAIDADRFKQMQQRLKDNGVRVDGPILIFDGLWSIYLHDPNGIRLEFSAQLEEAVPAVVESVRQPYEEARTELATLCDDAAWVDNALRGFPG